MPKKTSDQIKKSYLRMADAFFELLESSLKYEDKFEDLFTALILQEINGKAFEQEIKQVFFDRVRDLISRIKQESKLPNLYNAYYDVARYQTDPLDATIEWKVHLNLLQVLLKKRPVPTTPEGRHALIVPEEVIKKRELPIWPMSTTSPKGEGI